MILRTKNWLKGCGALIVFFGLLVLVAGLRPKAVAYRIYGVEDEATGGWMLVELVENSGFRYNPFESGPFYINWKTADGRVGVHDSEISLEAHDNQKVEILVNTGGTSRLLELKLLAIGEQESSQTGWDCWGHATILTRESTVLNWQLAMPAHAYWKTLEREERASQWELLDSNQVFGWADWIKSFQPDEPKVFLHNFMDQKIAAMGSHWVVLRRDCFYGYGNYETTFVSHVVEAGRQRVLKIEELFGGKIPWDLLLPHLRETYPHRGLGGVNLDPKDVDKALMESGSIWPNSVGLSFSCAPSAIALRIGGRLDSRIPLSAFADSVDWNGPARLIWPKEAAKRAKKP